MGRRDQTIRSRFVDGLKNGVDYMRDLGVRHSRENRQRETGAILIFSDRKTARTIAKCLLIKGLKMQRDEMHAASNALASQRVYETVAVDAQPIQPKTEDVQMPGRLPISKHAGIDELLAVCKGFEIAGRNGLALPLHAVAFRQLHQAHGRL